MIELTVDVTYTDEPNQSIDITVNEIDTGKSDTLSDPLPGENTYELTGVDGDTSYTYDVDVSVSSQIDDTPTVNGIDVAVPGTYNRPEQNKLTAEAAWDEQVIETLDGIVEPNEYLVELTSPVGTKARFQPTNVSFRPSVNSAKDASVDCEPFDWLEDDKFLGAVIELYANDDRIYIGTVTKIGTNQNDDDYTIDTRSKGKQMSQRSTLFTVDTELLPDVLAHIIDDYNTVQRRKQDMEQTADETLSGLATNIDGSLRVVSGSGTATYTDVSDHAHELHPLYVKCYAPDGIDVVIDDGVNTYSETITNDPHEFGQWEIIKPTGLGDSYYNIEFTIHGNSYLHDWTAVANCEIWREIDECGCSDDTGYNDNIYTYSNSGEGIPEATSVNKAVATSNGYEVKQKSLWQIIDSGSEGSQSVSGNTVNGYAISTETETYWELPDFRQSGVSLPAWELWARVALHNDNGAGSAKFEIELTSANERIEGEIDTGGMDEDVFEWVKLCDYSQNEDVRYDFAYVGKSGYGPQIRGLDAADDDVWFGEFVAIVGDDADVNYEYEFSEQLVNGHLDKPMLYDSGYIEFESFDVGENIIAAKTDTAISNIDNPVGNWGPLQTTDATSWDTELLPNSRVSTELDVHSGTSHTTRVYITGSGERDTATPRLGYQSMELTQVDVTATYSDLPVVYDKTVSDNILAAASDIVRDTRYLFRLEGDTVVAFERGKRTTDIDLRSEEISSNRSIENVVSSVEVIGLDGVSSGRIVASDAPDFVENDPTLREQSVETESQAIAAAEEYIREHSDIQYEGSITTLPTLAPLGEQLPGELFSHGKPMTIESVSYSKNRTGITLGRTENVSTELIRLNKTTSDTTQRVTR